MSLPSLGNFDGIGLYAVEVGYEYLIEVGEVYGVNCVVIEMFMVLLAFVAIALFLTIALHALFLLVFASTFDSLE